MATKKKAAPAPELAPEVRPGRGGWRGGGRPKAAPGALMVIVSLRFTAPQREKLAALGGATWIRARLDGSDKVSTSTDDRADGRLHSAEPNEVLHVTPVRLTPAQRDKLANLGGAAWLRKRINLARLPK